MGGYTAIEVAAADPRVSAVAVDDAYTSPPVMVQIHARQSGTYGRCRFVHETFEPSDSVGPQLFYSATIRLPRSSCRTLTVGLEAFHHCGRSLRHWPTRRPDSYSISHLQPKRLLRNNQSYRDMSDDDRKNYESQIVNFFLEFIPPSIRR